METIYDLKKRAKELSEKNEVNSVSPVEVGNLIDDTLNIIDEYNKNVVGLGIRKTYPTIASMQADTDPVGNDGKPIRFGQLVSVYDEINPDSEENGGVYAYQSPGWKLVTTTAINVVSEYGDSETAAISQKFFTDQFKNETLFTDLGIVDETISDDFAKITTEGYYTYQKGYNEGEAVKGILIVSNVSYPGATALTQVKMELGMTYIRSFDIDERIWGEWVTNNVYEDARENGYAGDRKTFYKSLSVIDNLSIIKIVNYDDIDTIKTSGIYNVRDSDSITSDIMFVASSGEHDLTKQIYINTNPNFIIPEMAWRTHDGKKWSEWRTFKDLFKSELGNGIDCGISQKFFTDTIGSEATSEMEDTSVWGKLISIEAAIAETLMDIRKNSSARFDDIITNASIVIGGITNATGGKVVYVPSKNRFAYLLNDRYYENWPGYENYIGADKKVITDKVYLCGNRMYVYHDSSLLPSDEYAATLASKADVNAQKALDALSDINGFRFSDNLTIKLSDGKTFGKFMNGDVIHCKGMTAIEVIQMALDETTGLRFNSFLMDIPPEQNTDAVISGNKEIRFVLNDPALARDNSLSIIDITADRTIASGLPVTSPVTVDIGTVTADAGQNRQWKATVIDSTGKTIDSPVYTVTWKAPVFYLYYGEVAAAPESAAVVKSGNKIVSTTKQFQISAENKVGNFIAFPATMALKSIENASFSGDWWYSAATGDDFYDNKQVMTIDGVSYNVWCMIRPLPMGVKANVVFN